jgi:uncharacterized DUF497 family protein
MDILWDEKKNDRFKENRSISFESIAGMLLEEDFLDIVENPKLEDQLSFVLNIQNYTWLVPFVINENSQIVLKTAFPSSKFHKRYGG